MCSPDEGPRRTETTHFFILINVSRAYFMTIYVYIYICLCAYLVEYIRVKINAFDTKRLTR